MTDGAIRSLAQAVETYYEELKAFLTRRTGSSGLASDIIQETWIRATTTKSTSTVHNPRAYLYRMASNVATDHLRQVRRQVYGSADDVLSDSFVDPQPGPEEIAVSREELTILSEAIRELPEKCRAVFLLYRGQGRSMREIAETLNISEKTVEKHIAKAMLHCRERLHRAGRSI